MDEQFWYLDASGVPQALRNVDAVLAALDAGFLTRDRMLFDPSVGEWKPAVESPQLQKAVAEKRRHNPWRFVGANLSVSRSWHVTIAMTLAAGVLFYIGEDHKDVYAPWVGFGVAFLIVLPTSWYLSAWQRDRGVRALIRLWVAGAVLVAGIISVFV